MIPPEDMIEYVFGVKISRKAAWIINLSVLVFIILMVLLIKSKHSG